MGLSTFDIVTVFHNKTNFAQAVELEAAVKKHATHPYTFVGVDNRAYNRGFAKGCNYGAVRGNGDIIAFLNPDLRIHGPFMSDVELALTGRDVVITGERFNKPQREVQMWGLRDWVCGAAMFVDRRFWQEAGGFDDRFVWGWEETDLCRRAELANKRVKSIILPFEHDSPSDDSPEDIAYKRKWFNTGAQRYRKKWHGR